MEDRSRSRTALHDFHLASRKAEEAALRRFQAAAWLESFVGPLGLSDQPSEREFVSCLRNGLVLCNAINKIQPGAVPKVIGSQSSVLTSETQPLNAYQYFENVRNFLLAVEELNLPAFEASDLERDTLDVGSTAKIVDCILALKSYHEWKQWRDGANGSNKHSRSPMVPRSASRTHSRVASINSSGSCRHLDMAVVTDKTPFIEAEKRKLGDSIAEVLVECLLDTKENIDRNLLASFLQGNKDSVKFFNKIMTNCLQEQQLNLLPELKSILQNPFQEVKNSSSHSTSTPSDSSGIENNMPCKCCLKRGNCNHKHLLEVQENDLSDLKALLSQAKEEFKILQYQLQSDLKIIGSKVQELSSDALGYQRVIKENWDLYNMVQDLKGNIRVYCRIRPAFGTGIKNSIDFIGDDGSLVVVDPLKPRKDAHKLFRFNRVFGPAASQEEVFKATQPLIRSVMDGYNVCIFAYGQTGSGKTHTMCGPLGASSKDMGINYLSLEDLFQISSIRKDIVDYEVRVQMVEIYNEQVRDLLTEDTSTTKLEIRNCTSSGGLSLPDATMHIVKSSTDVHNLMKLGEMHRAVSSTAINNGSSRSHSVLTVHVCGRDNFGNILRSCLHLVDLAGSERVDKSEVTGDRLKEAQYINKSLSCLGDVITALAQKNSHIPYRNSKLTQLLQDSLGGHAKTLMFAHVSPEANSYGETISTLKFAQRVSTVELGVAHLNKESSEVRELREQVESLKKALASKEAQTVPPNRAKEMRSPQEKEKVTTERTPPRPRGLSIESSTVAKTEKEMNSYIRKRSKMPVVKAKLITECTPNHPRRLSLEGPKYEKDQFQIKSSEDVCVSGIYGVVHQCVSPCPSQDIYKDSNSEYDRFQNAETSVSSRIYRDLTSLRSPTNSAAQSGTTVRTASRIRPVQPPKTPEPLILARNEIQTITPNKFDLSNKSQIPSSSSSTCRKGSQIRKSLHTIGKLINASDKRNHQYPIATQSPINGKNNINDESPITASAKTLRRQSLTGVQGSGSSRRSSLGGRSTDSYSNENRNARTPPPVHPSAKMTKRWF